MPTGGFTQNLAKTIFFASLSLSLFALSFLIAFAQDAIQCTPGDVNLNRNLKFVNTASNNIYLGTGKLNFSSTDANLYAANDSGNLLLHNASANILIQSNNILFSDDIAGNNRLAGIYASGAPAAANDNHFLIVNGKIEGWQVNGLNQLCISGSCLQAADRWSGVCDPAKAGNCSRVKTTGDIESGANLSANGNIYTAGGNVAGNQLCIGASCIASWAAVMSAGGGGISMTNNLLTMGNGAALRMDPGSKFEICDAAGNCSTGQGVSKIIAGSGIAISSTPTTGNPGSGIGDVIVSTKIIWCNGACPAW